ncbi:MAG TPA: hypothetical protein VN688_31100 [Gemmataceae bacterium]|nr:hypothetical protein [Gemmataceae bacterium]
MPVPDRSTFESAYAGQSPWDIGRPNKVLEHRVHRAVSLRGPARPEGLDLQRGRAKSVVSRGAKVGMSSHCQRACRRPWAGCVGGAGR